MTSPHDERWNRVLAGLPLESWVLIGAAVGLGLAIELVFLWTQRHGEDPER